MWTRKRCEEPPNSVIPPASPTLAATPPAPVAPHPVEAKKEATSVSSSMGKFEGESRGIAAAIGKGVKIVGQIFAKEDLIIDGTVEGTIEMTDHKLTIGPNGTMQVSIKAREVLALGNVQGNVDASERIEIRKDAKLVGDIRTARIIIEDGAYFKGSIDIIKPEPKAAVKPVAAAPVSVPVATAAPRPVMTGSSPAANPAPGIAGQENRR